MANVSGPLNKRFQTHLRKSPAKGELIATRASTRHRRGTYRQRNLPTSKVSSRLCPEGRPSKYLGRARVPPTPTVWRSAAYPQPERAFRGTLTSTSQNAVLGRDE
jgi:hypothetical protein